MLVVTPTHPGDIEQAFRQAQWIRELGRLSGHDLLLIADTRCSQDQIQALHLEYVASYDHVEVLDFVDHYRKWPESPNQVFGLAARHIMRTKQQPWLFLEPDAVPLKTGWLDELWAEYQKAGKPFMGDFVSAATAGINVVDHMSGNAIWPADIFTHAGLTLIADVAFDIAGASQIVPQMHKSELILHRWKSPPFESWEQAQERIFDVKPRCVLFHANKTGELITLLRDGKSVLPEPNRTSETLTQERLESVRAALDIADQTPWADKDSSLTEIGRLSSRLKQFCTHPSRVRTVRLALHEAGVIQLPYRFKKRGKWRKKK